MTLRAMPIQRKLMLIILTISVAVMLLMRGAFFFYEYVTFRQATVRQLSTLGEILTANSTAALAFENHDDARDILSALRAERHIVAAALYDRSGKVFAHYPDLLPVTTLPSAPDPDGYRFADSHLVGFQPVVQGQRRLGTLYLRFDTGAILREFIWGSLSIAVAVMAVVLLVAYLLSRTLQKQISEPILTLTETARAISDHHDFSVRAVKQGDDELGLLTDAFNHLLAQIHAQKAALDEHAIVAITNPQGRITYVNDKFCAISKYSREELLGQDHRIINSGHHSKEFIRDLWTTITHGRVWKGEIKNRAKDGSVYWVDTTIVPFLKPDGKPYQYVAIRADVTQRKLTEERLQASLKDVNDLKAALDEHAIVAITNPQGRITYVNDKFCAISKYSRAELLGQDHRIINSGHHSKEFIRDLWTTIAQGRVWKGEIKNRAKDGSIYWVDTTIVPFLKPDGKPYQYVAIRADVTQRKLIEEEIRRLNQELESRVDERTAQLEAANKELEAFSYSVSHDLRAPLRHIDGFAGLLVKAERQNVTERGRSYLANIADSAKQMGRLIDDLLVFSRMGRADMRISRVDLTELVDETIRLLQPEIQQRRIVWRKAPLPVVHADPPMLRQVLVNLLANAVKYTGPRNPAVIEIGCRQDTPDGFIISVRDNGVGFEMRYADKLFGVFQRLHRAEDFEGTGIGLANVRRIVNRHGGRTWAEGEPGVGATFYFTLPKSRNPSS